MKSINFAGHKIGYKFPCFIVAEIGVNHNGSVETAKHLVDAAKKAGADAVKFQTWVTEKLVTSESHMAEYQKKNLKSKMSHYEMLKWLELSQDQFREIKLYSEKQEILFFSTPDEEESADFLEFLGVDLYKIGSGEVTNLPLLSHIAKKGKPIILSTGMSTLGEVESAVHAIENSGNTKLILLHCVSNYPANPVDCNLRVLKNLSAAFGYPVGFSDHTLGTEIAIAAVVQGACLLEKHFTLDKEMEGPDHKASLNPDEFSSMVKAIRRVEKALGDGVKRPVSSEKETKIVVQKTLVVCRDIKAGEIITESDLILRCAGGGLSYIYLPLIIGRSINRDLKANSAITLDMLC